MIVTQAMVDAAWKVFHEHPRRTNETMKLALEAAIAEFFKERREVVEQAKGDFYEPNTVTGSWEEDQMLASSTAEPITKCDGQLCYYHGCQHLPGCAFNKEEIDGA